MSHYTRVFGLVVLSLSLLLIGIAGIYGGVVFLLDPSGELMGMPLSYLDGLPIDSYLLPGLWLLLVIGIGALLVLYALWARPSWSWTAALERRGHALWAWIAALALSSILLLQLCVELLLGMIGPPTVMTGVLGLAVFGSLLTPVVRARYARPPVAGAME